MNDSDKEEKPTIETLRLELKAEKWIYRLGLNFVLFLAGFGLGISFVQYQIGSVVFSEPLRQAVLQGLQK